jgi:hypothetical protein
MMKHKITTEYVRGFFDGEGCITFGDNHHRIVITNTDWAIIKCLKEFLDSKGIRNQIQTVPKEKNKKATKDCFRIMISGVWDIYLFWKKIGTNKINKEKKFQGFLNLPQVKDKISKCKLIPMVLDLSMEGLTLAEIARRTGLGGKYGREYIHHILDGRMYKRQINDYINTL